VDAAHAGATAQTLRDQGETVYRIGRIAERSEGAAVEVR
jgi:phosphoribosylformylglycinamidine cyclo-ligase